MYAMSTRAVAGVPTATLSSSFAASTIAGTAAAAGFMTAVARCSMIWFPSASPVECPSSFGAMMGSMNSLRIMSRIFAPTRTWG